MNALAHEGDFARALLGADATVPVALKGCAGNPPARRFAVYRNNVYASLIDVLASRFPASEKLVGKEFFRAMGRLHVEKTPPTSAVLLHYGADFADFVAAFPPAAAVPYLADVARLEWARHKAYHAADAEPLRQDALAAFVLQADQVTLVLHPSLQLVRSAYPVITIWSLAVRDPRDEPVQLPAGGEVALVVRPALDVEVRCLPEGGPAFIQALTDGATLLDAASRASQEAPAFDLAAALAGLMTSGAIVGASIKNHRHTDEKKAPRERAPLSAKSR